MDADRRPVDEESPSVRAYAVRTEMTRGMVTP